MRSRQSVSRRLALGVALCVGLALGGGALAQAPSCKADLAKLCPDAKPGGGQAGPRDSQLPAVEFSVIEVSFERVADPALREYLQNLPTSFALSDEAVDRVRAAAAEVLRESPAFRSFVAGLSRPR
jgi:hypothetical protein